MPGVRRPEGSGRFPASSLRENLSPAGPVPLPVAEGGHASGHLTPGNRASSKFQTAREREALKSGYIGVSSPTQFAKEDSTRLMAARGTEAPYHSFRGRDFDDFASFVAMKGTKGLYYSFRGKEMRCGWSGVQFRRWATEHHGITESAKKDAIKKMEEAFKKK